MLICVQLNPTVDRILEVPGFAVGETLRVVNSATYPLGKAVSVALAAVTLGETPLVVSLVGEGEAETYEQFLSEKHANYKLIPVPGKTRSNVTIIDPTGGTTTHLRERGFVPPQGTLRALSSFLEATVTPESVVIFSGSLPPGVPDDAYAVLLRNLPPCKARGLDTSGPALLAGMVERPTLVKPNLEELQEIFPDAKANFPLPSSLLPYVDRLRGQGIAHGAITLGEQGSLVWDEWNVVAASVVVPHVVDTVGCGDSFLAGLAVGLLQDWDLEFIARTATAAAGANAMAMGAGLFQVEDFQSLLERARVELLSDTRPY